MFIGGVAEDGRALPVRSYEGLMLHYSAKLNAMHRLFPLVFTSVGVCKFNALIQMMRLNVDQSQYAIIAVGIFDRPVPPPPPPHHSTQGSMMS